MGRVAKWIDLPPVWLALFLALGWLQADRLPVGPAGGPATELLAGLLVGGGILLVLLAVSEMRRQGTTVLPHREAGALVTSGIFARTRNPIYLGDLLILTGALIYWSAWPSLALVPLFGWLITDRFILDEERRLSARFGQPFDAYVARTPRWLPFRAPVAGGKAKGGRG